MACVKRCRYASLQILKLRGGIVTQHFLQIRTVLVRILSWVIEARTESMGDSKIPGSYSYTPSTWLRVRSQATSPRINM